MYASVQGYRWWVEMSYEQLRSSSLASVPCFFENFHLTPPTPPQSAKPVEYSRELTLTEVTCFVLLLK